MSRVNYLITGASGFLGQIIKQQLLNKGALVTGQGRSKQEIQVDISQSFSFPKGSGFEIVVHSAGKAHSLPRTAEEEQDFFQVNFEGTKNLCAAIDQLDTKPAAFIFISTVAVYGVDSGEMIREDAPLKGNTPYAKSKIIAEEWLKEWAHKNQIVLSILRLPLVAGPKPPGNLGAMINGIQSGRYLSIGKASARKSVVWAADIASIMPQLAKIGGTYHLTDGYHPTFEELEKGLAGAMLKKSPFKVPMAVARLLGLVGDIIGSRFPVNTEKINKITSNLTFDDSKAKKQLGWKPSQVLVNVAQMV